MDRCLLYFLLMLMSRNGFSQEQEMCSKKVINSCDDCIRSGPYCVWCKQLNFTKPGEQEASRCDTTAHLKARGCKDEDIVSPRNKLTIVKETPLSTSFNQQEPVQLNPQEIKLRLRPGLPTTFTLSFKRVQGYPVDLYYLMDLSYSMKDDLIKVRELGQDLFATLKRITEHAQIGFGSFVDKTVLPFTNTNEEKLQKPCDQNDQQCQPAFGYRHVLSMTDREDKFRKNVEKQLISGNLDSPEGSLDAMMQAAVCGDYPSVGQLASQLEKNNIQLIFAVTENVQSTYRKLSGMIPKSEVGVLSSDSTNVVKLIDSAYKRLSSKVTVTHDNLPDKVRVVYSPICEHAEEAGHTMGVCDQVRVGQEISFNITVTADVCMEEKSFIIRPRGIKDTLKVTLSTNCECQCDNPDIHNHPHCGSRGRVSCGICSCSEGFVGQFCQCAVGVKDENSLRVLCQRDNGTECEGRGDCVCGRCQCHTTESGTSYHGDFCECDDEHCEKFQNLLCGGNGKCNCGTCECYSGYEGSACQCVKSDESCRTENKTVCNGRGTCKCNRCECNEGYQRPLCKTCLGCPDPCQTKLSCIECLGFQKGPFSKNCSAACTGINHGQLVDTFTIPTIQCHQKDSEGCWIRFRLEQLVGEDNYEAEILRQRDCPKPPSVATIIGGSLAGVALIGILLLMLIKLIIYIKDLKEYRKFETEQKRSKWADAINPMFQSATTNVKNPLFTGE